MVSQGDNRQACGPGFDRLMEPDLTGDERLAAGRRHLADRVTAAAADDCHPPRVTIRFADQLHAVCR